MRKEAIWEMTDKTSVMKEEIIRCKDCEFSLEENGKLICSNPKNGGWFSREKDHFCAFGTAK